MNGAVQAALVAALVGGPAACTPSCEEVCFCDADRRRASLDTIARRNEEEGKRSCTITEECASLAVIIEDTDEAGPWQAPLGVWTLPAIRADACEETVVALREIIEETGGPQCAAQSVPRPAIGRTGVFCVSGTCTEQFTDDDDPLGAPAINTCTVHDTAKARCLAPGEYQ